MIYKRLLSTVNLWYLGSPDYKLQGGTMQEAGLNDDDTAKGRES
jgi:hypothetical protein